MFLINFEELVAYTIRHTGALKSGSRISSILVYHLCITYNVLGLKDYCFDLDSPCYAWTKALCLEAIRFTVAGWPFGVLRLAIRDGQISGGQHFNNKDLVLLNEPAVFHDSQIWPNFATIPSTSKNTFDPVRHLQLGESNSLLSGLLVNSSAGFLPRMFVYQALAGVLLNFTASHWNLEHASAAEMGEEETDAFLQAPCFLPLNTSNLPSVRIKSSLTR